MAESKHTKLPWRLTYADGSGDQAGIGSGNSLVGADDSAICFGGNSFGLSIGILKAEDAAYIVQCCNAYPKLVDAIRKLKEAINYTAKGECREKYGDEHGIGEYGEYDWTHFISFVCTDAIKSAGNALRDAGEEL